MAEPWRYGADGVSIAVRVTPRGGRDDIDGIEVMANGRAVLKIRVRAIAEGGEANRAVTELLASRLGVPKRDVRLLSGATSRIKQIAVNGDPKKLGLLLRDVAASPSDDQPSEDKDTT